jgi:dTDP-4-amino-4,6-dideoxygalactose transaminase
VSAPGIPLFDLRMEDSDLAAVEAVLRSGALSAGPRVEAFERAFAEHLGSKHALAIANCSAALHLAYLAAGVGPGDEVIVPSVTFAATAAAAVYLGATPVFADSISVRDFGLHVDDVAAKITKRTRAVCAMHYAGYPAAVAELRAICDDSGIALIEDAAHAPDTVLPDGRMAGTAGVAGCFSFFSNKVLAVGEGGLLCTDDDAFAARVRAARDGGLDYRFDEMRGALVHSRFARMHEDVERRRELTVRYRDLFKEVDGVIVPYTKEGVARSSCYVMPLLLEDAERRDAVRERMRSEHGVQTSLLYAAVHEFTAYRERFGVPSLPVAERISRSQVTVPLYGFMTHEQQDVVVAALAEALA